MEYAGSLNQFCEIIAEEHNLSAGALNKYAVRNGWHTQKTGQKLDPVPNIKSMLAVEELTYRSNTIETEVIDKTESITCEWDTIASLRRCRQHTAELVETIANFKTLLGIYQSNLLESAKQNKELPRNFDQPFKTLAELTKTIILLESQLYDRSDLTNLSIEELKKLANA